MAIRSTLNVSLTPELEAFVQSRVATGRYQTASEVVREGLRLLEEREHAKEAALEEIRQKLHRARDQARRGQGIQGSVVLEEIQELSARKRAERK